MKSIAEQITHNTKQYTINNEPIIRFTPDVPTCAQAWIVYTGATLPQLESIRDTIQEQHHIRVFNKLRPHNDISNKTDPPTHYLQEWMITTSLLQIDTHVIVNGFTMLIKQVYELLNKQS